MEKKIAQAIALFRFRIIAPVLQQDLVKQKEYFESQSERTWDVPHYGQKVFTPSAFKHWLGDYRRGGFDALLPSMRSDLGKTRKIDEQLGRIISEQAAKFPECSVSSFYRHLVKEGLINPPYISQSAVRRFVEAGALLFERTDPTPRKKYEKEHINQLWIADFLYGPKFNRKQTYLFAIIDDHSRMIVGSLWSFSENTATLELAFKEAVSRFGMPAMLYTDNGAAFSNQQLELACARLGVALVHSKPYDSPSRGKIERFFRTVRDKFLRAPAAKQIASLQDLSTAFAQWLTDEYHKSIHAGIGTTPLDRWSADLENISLRYMMVEELYFAFCQTFKRRVKNDSTIQLEKRIWQVPHLYIGKTIEVRYPTGSPDELYLFGNDKPVCRLSLCNPNENASLPANAIHFANEEES